MASIPLPDHSYKYVPIYGVEPFDVANLGAKRTNDNLLITAWRTPDIAVPGAQPVDFADILTPDPLTAQDGFDNANRAGYLAAMQSRYSCRFWFEKTDETQFGDFVSVVLNPPSELRQQMATAGAKYVGNDPAPFTSADLPGYEFSDSVLGDYAWEVRFNDGGSFTPTPRAAFGEHSIFVPFIEPGTRFWPYLRTSGADGNAPEFYDVTTPAAVREMIAAITAGEDFFVFMYFNTTLFSTGPAKNVDIIWPHSTARG